MSHDYYVNFALPQHKHRGPQYSSLEKFYSMLRKTSEGEMTFKNLQNILG
jgi:hypothetical protein